MDYKVKYEELSKDLKEAAYYYSREADEVLGRVDIINAFLAGAKWQKEQRQEWNAALKAMDKELDKWADHAIRGMKEGNPAYFQARIALIEELKSWIYEGRRTEAPEDRPQI